MLKKADLTQVMNLPAGFVVNGIDGSVTVSVGLAGFPVVVVESVQNLKTETNDFVSWY